MNEERMLKLAYRENQFHFWDELKKLKKYRFPVRLVIDNSAWWCNLKRWGEVDGKKTLLLPGQLN